MFNLSFQRYHITPPSSSILTSLLLLFYFEKWEKKMTLPLYFFISNENFLVHWCDREEESFGSSNQFHEQKMIIYSTIFYNIFCHVFFIILILLKIYLYYLASFLFNKFLNKICYIRDVNLTKFVKHYSNYILYSVTNIIFFNLYT